jgi:hypothetical protein
MLKKVIVSESQKNEILNLHHILNEEDGTFTIEGSVVDNANTTPIVYAKLTLKQNDTVLKNTQSDFDGKFKFDGLSSGSYTIVISAKNEGYTDKTEEVIINNQNLIDLTFKLEKLRELQEVVVGVQPITLMDFNFFKSDGTPVNDVKLILKKPLTNNVVAEVSTTNGKIQTGFYKYGQLVEKDKEQVIDTSTQDSIFYFPEKVSNCSDKKKLVIEVQSKYQKVKKKIEFCLKTATYDVSVEKVDKADEKSTVYNFKPKEGINFVRYPDTKESNIFNITLLEPTLSCTFKTIDSNKKPIPNVSLTLWGDKEKTIPVGTLQTNEVGESTVNINTSELDTLLEDSEDTKVKIYVDSQKDKFKSSEDSFNLRVGKQNEVEIKLQGKKPPKEPKPMSLRLCKKEIRTYYRTYIKTIKKKDTIESAGGEDYITEKKEQVKWCYINYQKKYSDRYEKAIRRLRNTATNYDVFELNFTLEQQRDIYKENRQMRINNTIRKVIFEQNEKKQSLIAETKIIKNRLGYIVENSNKYNLKNNLLKESNNLVKKGYDRNIVKESFIDIMTSMKDPSTFLTDVKNKLGQKIADTVKDKQQEHEMIMGAFGELDPSVVERAFKENKTDELSDIISKKAIENYKTQFGDGGIMGSIIASVDENKFKTEVSKLLQTAIDQVSSEMGEKMQDTVSDDETE